MKYAPQRKTDPNYQYRDIFVPNSALDVNGLRDYIQNLGIGSLTATDERKVLCSPRHRQMADHIRSPHNVRKNDYVEVAIVLRGEMTLWWEGTYEVCLPSVVVAIAPGIRFVPHVVVPGKSQTPHTVLWLALHAGCATAHFCQIKDDVHQLSEYHCFVDERITQIGRGIAIALSDRFNEYQTAVRGELICLMTILLRSPREIVVNPGMKEDRSLSAAHDGYKDKVENYLRSHYHLPFSLQQLSDFMGNSPSHVCRRYKESTGLTPFQFSRDVRIDAAKRLLMLDIPIVRVANMVGFEDPLYFSKVFSSQVGESPSCYRSHTSVVSGEKHVCATSMDRFNMS